MKKLKPEISAILTEKKAGERIAALHSQPVFQAILRHERSRANRDGSEFTLAVFDVSSMITNSRGVNQITSRICEKMRSIDEVGWLDARNIGVLLPVTNLPGGQRFATRVLESIPISSSLLPWIAYTYPSHWPPGSNGDSRDEFKKPARAGSATDTRSAGNESHWMDILGQVFCLRVPLWKRCMDIVGSLVLIALLSPLFLIILVYIKSISPGKVLFRQKRVGYQGKLFTFMKFRTMHENNDPRAHRDHLKELIKGGMAMEKLDRRADPRIIPGGMILRKACIDELPQLFNVLRGDMSLVGPRPCIPYEAEEYLRWHTHRFDILPGMTGLWQVSGKNKLSFEQMMRLDISYTKRMSLLLDLKILLLTVPTIIGLVFEATLRRLSKKQLDPSKKSISSGNKKGSFKNA
jgi:lipopolysaccharide/colanic/teichoic acid biosynthesis glycosyltransferase